MAKTNTLPLPQNIKNYGINFVNSDSFAADPGGAAPSNTKLLLEAGADDSLVKSIIVASEDNNAKVMAFWLAISGTKYFLGSVAIPANTSVDILDNLVGLPRDQSNRPVLALEATNEIYCAPYGAAITSGRTVFVTAQVEDY